MADKILLEKSYGGEYEPTDSEDEYNEEEKELLAEVRKGKEDKNKSNRQELMPFADSSDAEDDDEEEDDNDGEGNASGDSDDMKNMINDSDIEGAGGDDGDDLPDEMDWGKKSRNYYNTDFVDPDYSTYTAEEAELAKQEEEEAKAIQKRLAKQMKEQDFLDDFGLKTDKETSKLTTETTELKADFSGLSKREKQQLFQKDSPEFAALISDFKTLFKDVDTLHAPILKYVKTHKMPMIPALQFTQLYRNLALTYCSNISFYLLLKAKRVPIKSHPLPKRLTQLKKLLLQLQDKYDKIIKPQLEALLERIEDGDEFEILEIEPAATAVKKAKKSKLSILDQYKGEEYDKHENDDDEAENNDKLAGVLQSSDEDADEDNNEDGEENEDEMDEEERRGINYQIKKNKGLTPYRKKEARNPRVKHRSKFRKALIRRRGAVRTVRKETKRYGGEISGIKSGVVKSIKFKT